MDGKKNVNIWKTLQKVPAGTMFVPLIIGALITTVCQGMLHFDLWATLGNPMQDMFSSSGQMLAPYVEDNENVFYLLRACLLYTSDAADEASSPDWWWPMA